jgi:hypothetical protein
MAKYTVYEGQFICHTCKVEVKTLRLYASTKEATWMCPDRHISTVKFAKKKRDYEREDREQED